MPVGGQVQTWAVIFPFGPYRNRKATDLSGSVELDQSVFGTGAHDGRASEATKEHIMPKLLVPIDGSKSSMRALDYAMNIAKSDRSYELHLLTVHPEPIMYGEILVYVSQEKMHELQWAHSMDLLGPAIQAAEQAGIPHTREIAEGEIAPTIVNRAHELHCEAIIMGTRGMTAISSLIIGSIATKVIHLTKVPVTLVK